MAYEHGTLTSYTAGKCRCDECRGAMRDYQKDRYVPASPRQAQCATCGDDFMVLGKAKYCSDECRPQLGGVACRRCSRYYRRTHRSQVADMGLCAKCRAEVGDQLEYCSLCFIPWWWPGDEMANYCSEDCKNLDTTRQHIREGQVEVM
jgi:hypothetical protein